MYRKISIALIIIAATAGSSTATTIDLEALNSEDAVVPANYSIHQDGEIVATGQDQLTADLTQNQNYTIKQEFLLGDQSFNVTIRELNLTSELRPEIVVKNYTAANPYLVNSEKLYASRNITSEYFNAEISYTRNSMPDKILYCPEFDFSSSECLQRKLENTESYENTFQNSVFRFNVTNFSAYTIGDTAPRLNLTDIHIYNVTGLDNQEKREGGELVDTGVNRTFEIIQRSQNSYRFNFSVENTGTANWSIESSDNLLHQGLNPDWEVGDIWYELNGTKNGGDFSFGDLTWDTANNGLLTTEGTDSIMKAHYVVNITDTEPSTYQQAFNASDSDTSAEAYDEHEVRIDRYGSLNVTLSTPPNNTILRLNKSFYITANVTCQNYDCGTVESAPRYNTSQGQSVIPDSGEPFYLKEDAVKTCNLSVGERCELNWTANATGDLDSMHRIDVNASTSDGFTSNSSERHLVEIDTVIAMDLTFDVIDFGFLDPGEADRPAEGNSNDTYNVSIQDNSKPVDDLWIKGTDLVSQVDDSYQIGVSNISYGLQNNVTESETLKHSYSHLASNLDPGTNLTTYYWLDVPFGMTQSGYNGTITFKANSTE